MKPTRKQIEAVATAIGRELGPIERGQGWTDWFKAKVEWPKDYLPHERKRLRAAARAALTATSPSTERQPTPEEEADMVDGLGSLTHGKP